MEKQRRVVCAENEELVEFMWKKRQEMAERPKGISENIERTLQKAYSNVCNYKIHIKTLKELSQIKGVGKWILRLMQEFFGTDSGASEHEELTQKGKKSKGKKRYVPQKNSVAYALLITLYRGTVDGSDFMHKPELIDAAEASGLSRVPIRPEVGKGKPGQFGSSPREWYSGWSCMKTLVTKGLVVRSSCPAKYMLTEEGREAARECLSRSGLIDSTESMIATERLSNVDPSTISDLEYVCADGSKGVALGSVSSSLQKKSVATKGLVLGSVGSSLKKKSVVTKRDALGSVGSSLLKKPVDVPVESLDRFLRMGYTKEQILCAFNEVSQTSQNKSITSLWPAVLCHLREEQVYNLPLESHKGQKADCLASSNTSKSRDDPAETENCQMESDCSGALHIAKSSCLTADRSFTLEACSSTGYAVYTRGLDGSKPNLNVLTMPPLRFGERFKEAYEIILVLDDREQFTSHGSRSRKIIENIRSQFKIQIEVRRLPLGDGIWIARDKLLNAEYVLDFIVERKNVVDLSSSIRDNRYRDQKLRLLRCGLKKLIYLVEGDPNSSEAAESIKTACFTTEILEGFDVQRTSGLGDTLKKYGYLTQAITQYYQLQSLEDKQNSLGVCPTFGDFIKRCQHLDEMTVSDVFAIQLMQVPQVTEELAIAVLDLYPTLFSLAHAYSLLEGDICAQEEMLKKQSNNMISGVASKNIFQLVWGS